MYTLVRLKHMYVIISTWSIYLCLVFRGFIYLHPWLTLNKYCPKSVALNKWSEDPKDFQWVWEVKIIFTILRCCLGFSPLHLMSVQWNILEAI